MRFKFLNSPTQLSGDKILATCEYGDVMVFKGKLHISIAPDVQLVYSFINRQWKRLDHGCVMPVQFEKNLFASELIVKDNDFFIYIGYTDEQIKNYYRTIRESICYPIINRGKLWYDHLTVAQHTELNDWYEAWLDVTETHIIPVTPEWVNDKLNKIEMEELL